MKKTENSYESTRRLMLIYISILILCAIGLGALHHFFGDVRVGRIRWFNLDSERNIPTWFTGMLFFLFGCSALAAFYWEKKRNAGGHIYFRFPVLWLGIAAAGWFMSLDEITILHENLYWREVRQLSATLTDAWRYIAFWQLLYAPVFLGMITFMVIFFYNRFNVSREAHRSAFAGIACWITALSLEGVSKSLFKPAGKMWYSFQVMGEEVMEITGAIFLIAAIAFYTINIALNFTAERRERLVGNSAFFTRRAVIRLGIILLLLIVIVNIIFYGVHLHSDVGASAQGLFRRAVPTSNSFKKTIGARIPMQQIPSNEIWFDDVRRNGEFSPAEIDTTLRAVRHALGSESHSLNNVPAIAAADTFPRIVFLSVSDGELSAQIVLGNGVGIVDALEKAIRKLPDEIQQFKTNLQIKLDIVRDVRRLKNGESKMPADFERSLFGIAYDRSAGFAFLPEASVVHTLFNSKQQIRLKNIRKYLANRGSNFIQNVSNSAQLPQYRFRTDSYFLDETGFFPLYRGHRLFPDVTKNDLLSAARAAGNYLVRAVQPDGKFVYSYLPKTDEKQTKYNILRHAGTIYSMLELYEIHKDASLLHATKRAIHYLLQSAKSVKNAGVETTFIVEKGYVKLGGNALSIIALAKYSQVTGDQQYLPVLRALGKWILTAQTENGEFYIQKQSYPDGKRTAFVSEYYPGEALLALVRLYALDAQQSWLDAAEKGAQYLINVRDKELSVEELIHDHWLLYALNELYRYRPKPLYFDHARKIAKAIIQSQNRRPEFPDWLGSYYQPPRSTPTATRTEGLLAAYALERDFGNAQFSGKILDAAKLGIKFQLQTQFRPETVMYLKNPARSLGAFHRSLTNFEIRIDYVQHNISSLLGLYRVLDSSQVVLK